LAHLSFNFLPYPKGNRDEWIGKGDVDRLAGAFAHSESIKSRDEDSVQRGLRGLRDYANRFLGVDNQT
jgi:hypothetical protein